MCERSQAPQGVSIDQSGHEHTYTCTHTVSTETEHSDVSSYAKGSH